MLCVVFAVPAPPSLHTKVVNSSVIQAWWEPSSKMGQHQGYRLYYKGAPAPLYTGPVVLPRNASQYNITQLGERLFLGFPFQDPGLLSQGVTLAAAAEPSLNVALMFALT